MTTETTKTTARKTTARKTTARKATAKTTVAKNDIVFENVKQISEHYHLTSKNVRRLLRSNKDLLLLNEHQKNAVYKFNDKQSEAIKDFFDSKYKVEAK